MTITATTPVGEIAAAHPLATRVFARHRIDYCCGGGVALEHACADRGIDASAVLAEVQAEVAGAPEQAVDWRSAPLAELTKHIVATYHVPLKEELPRLGGMVRKVHRVHGDKDPERLGELVRAFAALKADLDAHLMKEEQILFPMIESGQGPTALAPMSVMEHEHEVAGELLARIRTLTDDHTPPPAACNTWRALYAGLAALETDLHAHIHLENNVLHPRARRGE